MSKVSQLIPWLDRSASLSGFVDLHKNQPNREWGCFLALDVAHSVHESISLQAESLAASWKATHEYVASALRLIKAKRPVDLDSYEAALIREEIGRPPDLCYPMYLLTVAKGDDERLVYIGKTSTDRGRFRGGHAALTKLHHPKYDGYAKRLYLGAIVFLTARKEYQPLEWVKPLERAHELLASVEAQLIYEFKPELNTQHVSRNNARWPLQIHIQNFSGVSRYLNDYFCYA